jgi:hypothetical protein
LGGLRGLPLPRAPISYGPGHQGGSEFLDAGTQDNAGQRLMRYSHSSGGFSLSVLDQ